MLVESRAALKINEIIYNLITETILTRFEKETRNSGKRVEIVPSTVLLAYDMC
jgi:hypothetical protein